ncbi:MAG: alpha-hydroxy-acid oxidizing protein [Lachnospiraceae bacterium]|nr:alpha-hydroxy-acid oxidizing protein [Lachnospiraceae bacterium]MBQ9580154.1 alpha-hydroxy-acid oxidizing protein [Lachnospiraceae bacterium]
MTYKEVLENARNNMGTLCKSCITCDGKACRNTIPGPGAKGAGDAAIRNYDMWQKIRLNMDTLTDVKKADTAFEIFGQRFALPVFAGPVGAVAMHYGDKYNDKVYNDILVSACKDAGIAAFTGDGTDPLVMQGATDAIKNAGGIGIPTIKPWNIDTIKEKAALVNASDAFAVAMDVDAAGLPFLKNMNPPAGAKSVDELKEIISLFDKPFIVKGIMTAKAARKAQDAGASAIVVSNHGGRVLGETPSTAEVLADIKNEVGNKMKIFVDGGIRTGADCFKALALGADAVIIARPFVNMVYGAEDEGVKVYVDKLTGELSDTMLMCGASKLSDINRDMLFNY